MVTKHKLLLYLYSKDDKFRYYLNVTILCSPDKLDSEVKKYVKEHNKTLKKGKKIRKVKFNNTILDMRRVYEKTENTN